LRFCDEFISDQAERYEFEFTIDSDYIFEIFLKQTFGFTELESSIQKDLNDLYFKHRGSFSASHQQIIDESTVLKSLMYFEDGVKEVRNRINKQEGTVVDGAELTSKPVNVGLAKMKTGFELVPLKHAKKKTSKKKSVYTHKSKVDRAKKLKGLNSETAVFRFLSHNKTKYHNIDWVASDSDGLHYDFRYTTKDGQLKYVEVKSFDNDSFSISRSEYDFGLKHKTDYELWLVRNNQEIFRILDFFTDPKYKGSEQPSEYVVRLKLSK